MPAFKVEKNCFARERYIKVVLHCFLTDFADEAGSSNSDVDEYDWEENSEEEFSSTTAVTSLSQCSSVPTQSSSHNKGQSFSRPATKLAANHRPKQPSVSSGRTSRSRDPEIEEIMEAMDRELAQTEVGKSFERDPPKVCDQHKIMLLDINDAWHVLMEWCMAFVALQEDQ